MPVLFRVSGGRVIESFVWTFLFGRVEQKEEQNSSSCLPGVFNAADLDGSHDYGCVLPVRFIETK